MRSPIRIGQEADKADLSVSQMPAVDEARSPGSAWFLLRSPTRSISARHSMGIERTALKPSASAAWSALGGGPGQDHPSGAGIIVANGYLIFPPFPCHRHPAPGHPLPDLPAHRGLPARHPQRDADRALPPGPSRSARPSRPVRSEPRRIIPLAPSPAATAPDPDRPRTRSVDASGVSPRARVAMIHGSRTQKDGFRHSRSAGRGKRGGGHRSAAVLHLAARNPESSYP